MNPRIKKQLKAHRKHGEPRKRHWRARLDGGDMFFHGYPHIRRALYADNLDSYSFRIDGKEWLKADKRGNVMIRQGYSSDGCSCAPDFKRAINACVLHDALRQAHETDEGCPWSRDDADKSFKLAMDRAGFKMSGLYYWAVAGFFGRIYSKLKGK